MGNILEEVQVFVADKLNNDGELSGLCQFVVENKKDIDYEIKSALGKQGIVGLVMTPKATYAGAFEDKSLAWQIDELEVDIVENVTVNRGKSDGYVTGQDASMRLFDVMCPLSGEGEGQFNPVSYEEGEDGNLLVNKCLLKCLVHKDEVQPVYPTQQQIVFADGTVVRVADLVFNDYFAMTNLCPAIGQSVGNLVEADIFSQRLSYSLSSPFSSFTGMKKIYLDESVQEIYQNEFANMGSLEEVFFGGRTPDQVRAMENYPWGIQDTSIIKTQYPFTPHENCAWFTDGTVLKGIENMWSSPEQFSSVCFDANKDPYTLEEAYVFQNFVGFEIFIGWASLKKVYFDDSVQTIGGNVFNLDTTPLLEEVYFAGRTMEQVQAMQNYPWGIQDTSIIHAEL